MGQKKGYIPWNKGWHTGQIVWNKGKKGIHLSPKSEFKKGVHISPQTQFKKGHKTWIKGKHLSEETKKKLSLSNAGRRSVYRGEKHHFWRGGITPKNMQVRNSLEYKLWRKSVFERDNYACIWCGARNGNGKAVVLHADHIKPFAYFPELRFAIDNGRTLCVDCHGKTSTYKKHLPTKVAETKISELL